MSRNQPDPWISCLHCGETVEETWKRCPCCETPIALQNMTCPGCRGQIKLHWKICPCCDYRLHPERQPGVSQNGHESCLHKDIQVEEWSDKTTGMIFVAVPEGSFMMGSNSSDADDAEKPVHPVPVGKFWIGKYPVTQKQWETVMGSNPSHFQGRENAPVERVSWRDSQEFVRKLNMISGERFRLPTEAEWEYACRGGTTADTYGKLDAIAWFDMNSGKRTHPVGKKAPNNFRLYDMLGNVWEWCLDWYGKYPLKTRTNFAGPRHGETRVIRGGSWGDYAQYVRAAIRLHYDPSVSCNFLGLRLAKD